MLSFLRALADPAPRPEVYLTVTFICVVVSFLICGVPFGKIISEKLAHVDLQKVGSGNIGTTNALRAGGPKIAGLTLLCDVLKGVICVNLARVFIAAACNITFGDVLAIDGGTGAGDSLLALVCLSCLCGHIFSPYLGFHGGKGIATGVGVLFALSWPLALIHLAIFIVLVAITKIVSVGSIATAALVGVTVALWFPEGSLLFKLIMAILGLLVVWAHRGNIEKLRAGKESKLSFTKRVTKMDDAEECALEDGADAPEDEATDAAVDAPAEDADIFASDAELEFVAASDLDSDFSPDFGASLFDGSESDNDPAEGAHFADGSEPEDELYEARHIRTTDDEAGDEA